MGALDFTPPADPSIYPAPDNPTAVAERIITDHYTNDGVIGIIFWRDDFWIHTGTHWETQNPDAIKALLYRELKNAKYETDGGGFKDWKPTRFKIADLMEAIKAEALWSADNKLDAPYWVQPDQRPIKANAADFIALQNGQFHLPTRTLQGHNPALFNTWGLDFEYDETATCPTWDWFIADTFGHDPNGALALQEFFGLLLTNRTDLQKGFLLLGPGGAGKGTITRTLKALVGDGNLASTKMADLADSFGQAHLIGKPVAVIPDATDDDKRRLNTITGTLKSIIGEDDISINRKNKEYWIGKLPTRFFIVGNETPHFLDASGAILDRFISVELIAKHRREGTEDTSLGWRILEELPGVFNWALKGLDRLESQGRFTTPNTMHTIRSEMEETAQVHVAFLRENYIITENEDDEILLSEVHAHYQQWCETVGNKPMSQNKFYQAIKRASIGVRTTLTSPQPGAARKKSLRGLQRQPQF